MNTITVPPIDVLRNRGFQAKVHAIVTDDRGSYSRKFDNDGQPLFETIWVRFTNWTMANLESPAPQGFGELRLWEAELDIRSTSTIIKTYAMIEDRYVLDNHGNTVPDMRYASLRLIDNQDMVYGTALTNAMFMATGVTPENAGEAMRRAIKEIQQSVDDRNQQVEDRLAAIQETTQTDPSSNDSSSTEDQPSDSSSDDGSKSDSTETSSGD